MPRRRRGEKPNGKISRHNTTNSFFCEFVAFVWQLLSGNLRVWKCWNDSMTKWFLQVEGQSNLPFLVHRQLKGSSWRSSCPPGTNGLHPFPSKVVPMLFEQHLTSNLEVMSVKHRPDAVSLQLNFVSITNVFLKNRKQVIFGAVNVLTLPTWQNYHDLNIKYHLSEEFWSGRSASNLLKPWNHKFSSLISGGQMHKRNDKVLLCLWETLTSRSGSVLGQRGGLTSPCFFPSLFRN